MHSTVSDGWRDPDEVAHLAADRGVRVMALTDHDTFLGLARARSVAHRRGLGYVPALEVTTYPPDQDLMKEVLPLVDGLEVYTRRHRPEQIPIYEELAARHGLLMTVGSDYHGFNGGDYEAPKKVIDIRYLDKLGARVQWPAVEQAG